MRSRAGRRWLAALDQQPGYRMPEDLLRAHLIDAPMRGISMTAESVLATLAGHKTETRRVEARVPTDAVNVRLVGDKVKWGTYDGTTPWGTARSRYGFAFDRLWVREKWSSWYGGPDGTVGIRFAADGVDMPVDTELWHRLKGPHYRRDVKPDNWRSGLMMPLWATRLVLELKLLLFKRLQDMDELDALAEGVAGRKVEGVLNGVPGTYYEGPCLDEYRRLWDEINARRGYSWESNPWVWVIKYSIALHRAPTTA